MANESDIAKKGRTIAVLIGGIAVVWVAVQAFGEYFGITHRTLALFDLAALAGFVFAFWQIYGLWRMTRGNNGE